MPDCVVCGEETLGRVVVRVDPYRLVECSTCRSWVLLPRPTVHEQSALHDSAEYFDHPYLELRRSSTEAVDRRCEAAFSRLAPHIGGKPQSGEQVLDIGCDTGELLLSAARQFGIAPVGIDVGKRAVAKAREAGVDAYATTLEEAPSGLSGFRAVTAIDVVEHVANPGTFFRALKDRLRPGGAAYFEMPNFESTVFRVGAMLSSLTGGKPDGTFRRLFPEEHVQYYSRDGLDRIARANGLRLAEVGARVLPSSEIAVGSVTKAGLSVLQGLDAVRREGALLWAVVRRPKAESSPSQHAG